MRAALLPAGLSVTLLFAFPGGASAQGEFEQEFEQEFGGEFEDEPSQERDESQRQQQEETPAPPTRGTGARGEQPSPQGEGKGAGAAEEDAQTPGKKADEQQPQAKKAEAEADGKAGKQVGKKVSRRVVKGGEDDKEDELRERRFRNQNTIRGPIGGIHVPSAGGGAVGSFRLQLATEFFFQDGFIYEGSPEVPQDDQDKVGGTLSLSWTPFPFLEIFASVAARATNNTRGDPTLLQTLGDTVLGVKGYYGVLPWLTVGGDVSVEFLNTVGDVGLTGESTSFGFRGNATADLRGLENQIPLIVRLGLQYWFDNSEELVQPVEQQRLNNLPGMPDPTTTSRHLVTAEERFGLGINRTDFFNIGLGFEAPIRVMEGFYLNPIVEWTWGIPVNRQDFNCLWVPPPDRRPRDVDSCVDVENGEAFPMDVTIGVRALPPVKGLSFLAAVDVAATGQKTFVRELAPNETYNVIFGMSYGYDTRPPEPKTVVREVEKKVKVKTPPPLRGRVAGRVIEKGTDKPVPEARVTFPEKDVSGLLADEGGNFVTYRFKPGKVKMALSHPDYHDGTCTAEIPDERPEEGELKVETTCELKPLPRKGDVEGTVVDEEGEPVTDAEVKIMGPQTKSVTTGANGTFQATDLDPGTYNVMVKAEDYLVATQEFELEARKTAKPEVALRKPKRNLVRVSQRRIQIRRDVNFETDKAEIKPDSAALMHQIADVLLRNPEIKKVEIQGHTDNRGSKRHNKELSQNRAESVRQWLVDHGVDGSRLTAKGFGESDPLVPNITAANRARNRRVEFHIKERADSGE